MFLYRSWIFDQFGLRCNCDKMCGTLINFYLSAKAIPYQPKSMCLLKVPHKWYNWFKTDMLKGNLCEL